MYVYVYTLYNNLLIHEKGMQVSEHPNKYSDKTVITEQANI